MRGFILHTYALFWCNPSMMNPINPILNQLSTAIMVFDQEGRCELANEAAQSLLQMGQRVLMGQSVAQIFPASEALINQCQRVQNENQEIISRELEVFLPQWSISLLIDVFATPTLDHSNPAAKPGLLLELTDRKGVSKLAKDANTAARYKSATQIVRGLCHEIKNPLGGIRGAAQLLSMEVQDDALQEYAQVITREVDRLSELLDRMSTTGPSMQRTKTDIHEIILQSSEILKAEYKNKLEIELDFDTSLPAVIANVDQLKQAMLNVMKNAAQWAAPSSNTAAMIKVKTRAVYPSSRRSLMPQKGIQIQIQDNGPGVSSDIIDQLFMPMVSRREGGTGLGLSLSQQITQSHSGFIQLDENQPEFGASFSIFLPFEPIL